MNSSQHELLPEPPGFYGRDGQREQPAEDADKTYRPSKQEIEESCRRIRENWSEAEHRRRAGVGTKRLQLAVVPCRVALPTSWELDR